MTNQTNTQLARELAAARRQLDIAAALERVRARAEGMQESSDLHHVVGTLADEIHALGIPAEACAIHLIDLEVGVDRWAVKGAGVVVPWMTTSIEEVRSVPSNARLLDAFERGDAYGYEDLDTEEAQGWLDFWIGRLFEAAPEQRPLGVPKRTGRARLYAFNFTHGWVFLDLAHPVGTWGEPGFEVAEADPLTEHEIETVRRFTDVFDYAYGRFRELEEKEDQNRELTIQNAIERVRARALGMQASSELDEVSVALFDALADVGIEREAALIEIGDEEADEWRVSIQLEGSEELVSAVRKISDIMAGGKALGANGIEAWRQGKPHIIEAFRGDDWLALTNYWSDAITETNPDYVQPDEYLEQDHLFVGYALNRFGSLGLTRFDAPISEDEIEVMKRFSQVFEFAYSRFLELKEKEERAREAELRAAVDRVRAEATAMKETDDIANVVKALWEGLVGQSLAFATLVFRVEDEQAEELQMYVATRDGASGLTFPEENLMQRGLLSGVSLYRSTMPLEMVQAGGEMRRGVYSGFDAEVKEDVCALWGFELPDDLIARTQRLVVPFAYGQISVIREEEPFAESDLERAESFAEGVSLGFTRYFDFRRLEAQNVALEAANEDVREATRLKSQFLATMSHELRTPMNAIIGFTRLVLRRSTNLNTRQRENLERVQLSAGHLLALINDILDLSKVEAGRVDVAPSTFEAPRLLERCCATVGPTLGKAGVALTCEIAEDVGEAYTDEARLRQIVINLLSNALKFTDQGEVRVTARNCQLIEGGSEVEGGEALEISVSDTGIGIPENQREAVFEEFRQVDGSNTRRHQGTGLGLAITRRLIELLGGTIWLESEVGKGSTFTFRVPVRYSDCTEEAEGGKAAATAKRIPVASGSGAEHPVTGRARTIVSIDDDPNVAVLLRQELETEGYRVISALTADEGVALVKKHRPAVVTVDILMPGKDGWQAIGMLKEDAQTRDIPIVVLSAIENRSMGLAMGVKDYLIKPVDRGTLLAALGRVDNGPVKDVLVVDDEPSAADLLKQILSEEGLSSRRAADGREALARIAERVPDAILLDLMMPEMDGFEVIAKLQEDPIWSAIPVIVVTAKDLESGERTYLGRHVEEVMQKGRMDPSRLLQAVRDAVGRNG